MSSATSDVREALEGYLAGRINAGRVVEVVAAAYYGEGGRGKGEGLRPLVELIERAAPGSVELARSDGGAGFDIKPATRAFPREYESELRAAVEAILGGKGNGERGKVVAAPGLLARIVQAIRRLFR